MPQMQDRISTRDMMYLVILLPILILDPYFLSSPQHCNSTPKRGMRDSDMQFLGVVKSRCDHVVMITSQEETPIQVNLSGK